MQADSLKVQEKATAAEEAGARQNYQHMAQTVDSLRQSAKVATQKSSASAAQV